LFPNFADQLEPGAHSRLSRVASTFLRWRFTEGSCVNFVPSAGALANGQIGMFITSDPRYELTATGQDAVRLVHEFNGSVAQISQPMCLPVPRKQGDWLFVEDAHESDIRFTRQGTLWVIAFTDIDITSVGSSLGEFRLDYNCELRDNSIEGAVIAPMDLPVLTIYSVIGQGTGITLTTGGSSLYFGVGGSTVSTATPVLLPSGQTGFNIQDPTLLYRNDPQMAMTPTQTATGLTMAFNQLGLYHVKIVFDLAFNEANITASPGVGNWYGAFLHCFDYNLTATTFTEIYHTNLINSSFVNNTTNYTGNMSTMVSVDYYVSPMVPGEVHTWSFQVVISAGSIASVGLGINQSCVMSFEQIALSEENVVLSLGRGFPLTRPREPRPVLERALPSIIEEELAPEKVTLSAKGDEVAVLQKKIKELEMDRLELDSVKSPGARK